jgi:TldD protein
MIDFSKMSNKILEEGAEYADLRVTESDVENIALEDSILSSIQRKEEISYGARVFYKGAWGFVYGSGLEKIEESLKRAWQIAKINSSKVKEQFALSPQKAIKDKFEMSVKENPVEADMKDKINRLLEVDSQLKKEKVDSRSVSSVFSAVVKNFYNSEGSELSQKLYSFNFRALVVGKENGNIVRAFERFGKKAGYETFKKIDPEEIAKLVHGKLLRFMKAEAAPAGRFPVVVDNGLCEVFFHEAVGHACEGDEVLDKASILGDRFGKKIASDELTLIDTPLIDEEFGFFKYDDEGTPAQQTVLIDKGVLSKLMQSRETASRLNVEPTGNGRSENPRCMPYPRMTNTFLKAGNHSEPELFEGIKRGIYAKGSSGGVVEPNNGNFLFNAEEAFLIENGKITKPLRDVSLAGNIIDILNRIERIGKDSKRTFFGGACGKKGQWVPVGGKAPHIMISEAMVGGQSA